MILSTNFANVDMGAVVGGRGVVIDVGGARLDLSHLYKCCRILFCNTHTDCASQLSCPVTRQCGWNVPYVEFVAALRWGCEPVS